MASDTYHEPLEQVSEPTRDLHRAISSLMEELEAVDWYHQRAGATQDAELRAVLEHNRDEETEHAMMVLEWIRRNNPVFDKNIKTYLQKQGPITGLEAAAEGKSGSGGKEASPPSGTSSAPRSNDSSLGIGSLKGT
ncbi:MAG: ferritin-like domain-containing protein [Byssovorax sp.]